MFTRYRDFDRNFLALNELRRRMDRLWEDWTPESAFADVEAGGGWPRVNVFDAGQNLVVEAEVPGLSEKDVSITVNQDVLTISGERRLDVPQGYATHRQERTGFKFSRSFALPTKVDTERTSATLKDGVLTLSLAKAPEAQPRKIAVRAQ
jgi:HSP20 family protein